MCNHNDRCNAEYFLIGAWLEINGCVAVETAWPVRPTVESRLDTSLEIVDSKDEDILVYNGPWTYDIYIHNLY